MLLPSDVARLVLGYLQEEGLTATSRTFINESPNLKEYAEYTVEDGVIPACVFSVFGKGLTTILNEYMATKTKESSHEVPAMMTSLWKKLDFTLKQIKSLQTSPATSGCQRVRSRIGVANLVRQRALTVTSASTVVCSSLSETSSITCPAQSSHCIISHSTPVSYSGPNMRAVGGTQSSSRLLMPRDSPLQITVSESRLNPGPMSPGRRKWDTPRKRSIATSDSTETPQPEEAVDENFPQLVIQNARDKILGDRSLQEKLAENINKILANEPVPQTSKTQSTTIEADQSIDEILGLQGEIHMSDDAIHDILEQTESDPAFQALFDLFEYNKTKPNDAEPMNEMINEDLSSNPAETEPPGPSSTVELVQNNDQGAMQVASVTPLLTGISRVAQPRKNRKTTLLRKTLLDTSGRSSRIEKSSAKLLNPGPPCSVPSAAVSSLRSEQIQGASDNVVQIEVDEPASPYSTSGCMSSQASQENSLPTSAVLSESFIIPSTTVTTASGAPSSTNFGIDGVLQSGDQCGNKLNNRTAFFLPAPAEQVSKAPSVLNSSSGGQTQSSARTNVPLPSTSSATTAISPTSTSSTAAKCGSSTSAPPSSFTPIAGDHMTENQNTQSKDSTDSSNIVSLKIIISDNNEQDSSSDAAVSQAVSSISTDKIPTIYLSSPAKSPRCSSRPNLDEAALAVNGLQNSEVLANCVSGTTGSVVTSTTPQAQQNYIIQLPVDSSNPPVQGAAASYFLVTEPAGANGETRQILVPAGVTNGPSLPTIGQFGVNSSPLSQGFTPGSTFILPSPGKPVMLPMSVMGQNAVQMVPNQIVAIPSQVPIPQAEKSKPSTVKQSLAAGAAKRLKGKGAQGVSSKQQAQQNISTDSSPGHRRILCFDASAGVEPQTSSVTPANTTDKSAEVRTLPQVKPNILSGNKPKRRVETVRCSADSQIGEGFGRLAEKSPSLQQAPQKDLKKNSRKQEHGIPKHKSQSKSADEVNASNSMKTSAKASASKDRRHSEDKMSEDTPAQDSLARPFSDDSVAKPGGRKDKDEGKETGDKGTTKSRDSRSDKRMQDFPNVTANKENEVKGSTQDQQLATTSIPPAISPSVANSQSKTAKVSSKTSSLAKQAAEMLQDIQGLNSPVKLGRRPAASGSDLTAPRTPGTTCHQEDNISSPRTPSRTRRGKDIEGTPKHVILPNTPDVPGCSPASEAGSENSINMAAHTLMILSRAAIARTGSPLKDSLRQEGVGEKSPSSSKTSKKRKQSSPAASPPQKKETKKSPVKKKEREKKKIVDCFPLDLDVDKFLSSLHYDE
ncbi:protein NPAT [Neosynchiropus ocellatus]